MLKNSLKSSYTSKKNTVKDMHSFFGPCSYSHRYMLNYITLSQVLGEITAKEGHRNMFSQLQYLKPLMVLKYSKKQWTLPFEITFWIFILIRWKKMNDECNPILKNAWEKNNSNNNKERNTSRTTDRRP